jgi:hypothetical protein
MSHKAQSQNANITSIPADKNKLRKEKKNWMLNNLDHATHAIFART